MCVLPLLLKYHLSTKYPHTSVLFHQTQCPPKRQLNKTDPKGQQNDTRNKYNGNNLEPSVALCGLCEEEILKR